MPRRRPRTPEPRYRTGEVRLTHNQVSFLLALLELPDGRATSVREWIALALPIVRRFRPGASYWTLARATRAVHREWVTRERAGPRVVVTLTARGRAIAERAVPARITGHGPFTGLPKAPPRLPGPWFLQYVPPAERPATLPPLERDVAGRDWRPTAWPRALVEIARFTAATEGTWHISWLAERVGRSWRLRAEAFPSPDASLRLHRRTALRPLSLQEMVALVDGTSLDGIDPPRKFGSTFLDEVILDWRRHEPARGATPCIPELMTVRSAIYPQLHDIYWQRATEWQRHLERLDAEARASRIPLLTEEL